MRSARYPRNLCVVEQNTLSLSAFVNARSQSARAERGAVAYHLLYTEFSANNSFIELFLRPRDQCEQPLLGVSLMRPLRHQSQEVRFRSNLLNATNIEFDHVTATKGSRRKCANKRCRLGALGGAVNTFNGNPAFQSIAVGPLTRAHPRMLVLTCIDPEATGEHMIELDLAGLLGNR